VSAVLSVFLVCFSLACDVKNQYWHFCLALGSSRDVTDYRSNIRDTLFSQSCRGRKIKGVRERKLGVTQQCG